jgi:cytochrome d ubiquinol oxidase subunit I
MTDLIAARAQMAMSLGFHIIFSAIAIALPVMMVLAEWRWLRTREEAYFILAKRWAAGSAILFAVGAVSGTVLSFELGLLWPTFMEWAGGIIGVLFSLEGFAFFTEAIFLGIYLYGWEKLSPRLHLLAGVLVVVSGVVSAVFVVSVNGWMNTPAGFTLRMGGVASVDPLAVMFNPSAMLETLHMVLAAFMATGFAVAGIHAGKLLRDPDNLFDRRAFTLALLVGSIPAVLQIISGDVLARATARHQPAKFAALEAHFHTEAGAAFHIGGIPDPDRQTVPYSLEIPKGLSLLLYDDPNATVTGLDAFPREEWPPVRIVHIAFQLMVACGSVLLALAAWAGWRAWRRPPLTASRRFLWAAFLCTPLGFLAMEAGWVATEVGRQPWIITGIMRTADAVTPMPGLAYPLMTFTALYLGLAAIVVRVITRHIGDSPRLVEHEGHAVA